MDHTHANGSAAMRAMFVVVSPANHLILKSYMYLTSKNVHCCVLLNKPYD